MLSAIGATGASSDWWLSGGISSGDVYGVWDAITAENLAASYVDLSGNENDLTLFTGTGAINAEGWDFSTGSWALDTGYGLNTSDRTRTIMIRLTNFPNAVLKYPFGVYSAVNSMVSMCKQGDSLRIANGSGIYLADLSWIPDSVICLAGEDLYIDGVDKSVTLPAGLDQDLDSMLIGAVRQGSSAVAHYGGSVCAMCIYDAAITAAQAVAVSTAIAEL